MTAYAEARCAQNNRGYGRAERLWLEVARLILGRKPTDEEKKLLFY